MVRPLSAKPGFIIGAAITGLFDGIVLHQILQWHHMICIEAHCAIKTVETLQQQNYYDGLFHAAMLMLLLAGIWLTIDEVLTGAAMTQQRFWGAVLFGGGVFNVVEGVVDHHILEIHHVRFGPHEQAWDLGFLALGATMAIIGFILFREARPTGLSRCNAPSP
jgi:uncharacterized membrane protein